MNGLNTGFSLELIYEFFNLKTLDWFFIKSSGFAGGRENGGIDLKRLCFLFPLRSIAFILFIYLFLLLNSSR